MVLVEDAPGSDTPAAAARLFELITGHHGSSAVHVAARLGLGDLLAGGPRGVGDLARETGADRTALLRLARLLVSSGVLTEPEPEVFALTPVGEHLARDRPDSLHAVAMTMASPGHQERWGSLGDAVRTGRSVVEHKGSEVFHEPPPEVIALLHESLAFFSRYTVGAITAAYDFGGVGTVVDVGGGQGALLAAILDANPDVRGTLLEQAFIMDIARASLAEAGVADRCETVIGDFFRSVPAGADLYLLKSVLHDWNDERAVDLLVKVREAMKPGARLLVVETVLGETARPAVADRIAARSDVMMLLSSIGGRERTEAEYRDLLARAGLRATRFIPIRPAWTGVVSTSLVEAVTAESEG
ncbi:methyltransferase [Saccharothrix australiensis]|uniref:Hydroxyneurosporene-O-methyltransferase n=1 Tax=Saccharothrix australiensis TaxID=2072 RepID=A0A495W2C4_9PSEU|nr:methyltransferase [Saccharothrix australiensis]RKT55619.1 hydroxyneurosporene-O-methyltransferase [Saccharothrix australiensis]